MSIAVAGSVFAVAIGLVAGISGQVAAQLAGVVGAPRWVLSVRRVADKSVRPAVENEVVLKLISAIALTVTMIAVLWVFPLVAGIELSVPAFGVGAAVSFAGVFIYFEKRALVKPLSPQSDQGRVQTPSVAPTSKREHAATSSVTDVAKHRYHPDAARYAGAGYGTSVVTLASPDRVWRIWSDVSTWGEWNPNVSAVKWQGAFASGATGIMYTRAGEHYKMRLIDVQKGSGFTFETSVVPGTTFRFNCRIESVGGETRISQTVEVKGPLGPMLGAMLGPQVSKEFGPLLANLAKRAESN